MEATVPTTYRKVTGTQPRENPEDRNSPAGVKDPETPGTQEEISEGTEGEKHIQAAVPDNNKVTFCWEGRRDYKTPNRSPKAYWTEAQYHMEVPRQGTLYLAHIIPNTVPRRVVQWAHSAIRPM